jgi:hypothetical protein
MLNLHIQNHPVIIPMTSRFIIWDFRLRIADCGLVESLRSINYNGPFDTEAHNRPFDTKAHDRPFDTKAHDRPFDTEAHNRQDFLNPKSEI